MNKVDRDTSLLFVALCIGILAMSGIGVYMLVKTLLLIFP